MFFFTRQITEWGMWCPRYTEWDPIWLSNHSWLNRWYYVDTTVLVCISISEIIVKSLVGWTWCHIFCHCQTVRICWWSISKVLKRERVTEKTKNNCLQGAYASALFIHSMNVHVCSWMFMFAYVLLLLHVCLGSHCVGHFSTHHQMGDMQHVNSLSWTCRSPFTFNKSIVRRGERERVRQWEREHPGSLTWLSYVNKVKAAAANNREHCLMSNGT